MPASVNRDAPESSSESEILGVTVQELSAEMRDSLGLPGGTEGLAVMDVNGESAAYEKGIRAGDVITEAGQEKIASVADLEDQIATARDAGRKTVLLLIRREGDPRFVALPVEE